MLETSDYNTNHSSMPLDNSFDDAPYTTRQQYMDIIHLTEQCEPQPLDLCSSYFFKLGCMFT